MNQFAILFDGRVTTGGPDSNSLTQNLESLREIPCRQTVTNVGTATCSCGFLLHSAAVIARIPKYAPVAQMDRALVSETKGRTFESSRAYFRAATSGSFSCP